MKSIIQENLTADKNQNTTKESKKISSDLNKFINPNKYHVYNNPLVNENGKNLINVACRLEKYKIINFNF